MHGPVHTVLLSVCPPPVHRNRCVRVTLQGGLWPAKLFSVSVTNPSMENISWTIYSVSVNYMHTVYRSGYYKPDST